MRWLAGWVMVFGCTRGAAIDEDMAVPTDMNPAQDLSPRRDLAKPKDDLSRPDLLDLSGTDLSRSDMTTAPLPDMSIFQDLSFADLSPLPDLAPLPDLTPPCGHGGESCCGGTSCSEGVCMYQNADCNVLQGICVVGAVTCGGFDYPCCDTSGQPISIGGYCHAPYRCGGSKCTLTCP